MMHKLYILNGRTPMKVSDPFAWSQWMFGGNRERYIATTRIDDGTNVATVSTVFLGIDHGFSGSDAPVLFETMVFGGPLDKEQRRCCFYKQAQRQHEAMVAEVKKALVQC